MLKRKGKMVVVVVVMMMMMMHDNRRTFYEHYPLRPPPPSSCFLPLRALKYLPRSYKLWHAYLTERRKAIEGMVPITHKKYQVK